MEDDGGMEGNVKDVKADEIYLVYVSDADTGIQAFLHPSVSLSQAFLIEVFFYKRCRNIACGSPLPAEDCNCEACSMRNGFCNLCMCVNGNKSDFFEVNTCRWIGCDLCSHWMHTDCAIRNGLIGPGPGVKTGPVPADMLTGPLHETIVALIRLFGSKGCATRGLEILAAMEKLHFDIRPAWL